ncbi:MAG: hypothetical protein WAK60_08795 [Sedimentisphaerales bacterium]
MEEDKIPDLMEICRRYPESYTEPTRLWADPSECAQETHWKGMAYVSTNLAALEELTDKFREQLFQNWHQIARIEGLEREILLLKNRCDRLERNTPIIVPIESFAPKPYKILKPFHIVVKFLEGQYIASFFDANLGTGGDTPEESVLNLKDLLIETFDILNEIEDEKLGPGPLQQKAVLKEFLSRI